MNGSALPAVDLTSLAHAYRLRPLSDAAAARAATTARGALDPLIDIGAGTGAQAAVWARAGRAAIAVDVSAAMVDKAVHHRHLRVVRAMAEALPFGDATAGLAHFNMSIHYGNWRASLSEAARVVRPGGRIEVWTFAPEAMESTSLGRWFPTVAAIDRSRFPDPRQLATHLASHAASVELTRSDEIIERTAAAWIAAVRGRFVSTLQLIDEDEMEGGIEAFRREYPDDEMIYRYIAPFTTVRCVV